MAVSSSGLGRGPLKAKTRVQISLGPPITKNSPYGEFFCYSGVPERGTRRVRAVSNAFLTSPREGEVEA